MVHDDVSEDRLKNRQPCESITGDRFTKGVGPRTMAWRQSSHAKARNCPSPPHRPCPQYGAVLSPVGVTGPIRRHLPRARMGSDRQARPNPHRSPRAGGRGRRCPSCARTSEETTRVSRCAWGRMTFVRRPDKHKKGPRRIEIRRGSFLLGRAASRTADAASTRRADRRVEADRPPLQGRRRATTRRYRVVA